MVIVFCVSRVPHGFWGFNVCNKIRQTCASKVIVFCVIVPESFMIVSSINVLVQLFQNVRGFGRRSYGEYPVLGTVSHMLGGAGFLPSTALMVWSSSNIPRVFPITPGPTQPISMGKGSSSRTGWAYSSACQKKKNGFFDHPDVVGHPSWFPSKCIILSYKILLLHRLIWYVYNIANHGGSFTERSSTWCQIMGKLNAFNFHGPWPASNCGQSTYPPGHVPPQKQGIFSIAILRETNG